MGPYPAFLSGQDQLDEPALMEPADYTNAGKVLAHENWEKTELREIWTSSSEQKADLLKREFMEMCTKAANGEAGARPWAEKQFPELKHLWDVGNGSEVEDDERDAPNGKLMRGSGWIEGVSGKEGDATVHLVWKLLNWRLFSL